MLLALFFATNLRQSRVFRMQFIFSAYPHQGLCPCTLRGGLKAAPSTHGLFQIFSSAAKIITAPGWLAAPAMNARDTTKVCSIYGGLTLDVDRHYIGSVTATTHQEKGIITLESNPSRGTVLPAPHGNGKKCDKNVKYKRNQKGTIWTSLFNFLN